MLGQKTTTIWYRRLINITHCHGEQSQQLDHKHCCLYSNVSFPVHCSKRIVTCPLKWLEMKCVDRFWFDKSCSIENALCASTVHWAVVGSRSVSLISVYTCRNYSNTARFRLILQSVQRTKFNVMVSDGLRKSIENVFSVTSVKLDKQSAIWQIGFLSSSDSL